MESQRPKFTNNPRAYANVFSIIVFAWAIPIFVRGYRNTIKLKDLFRVPKALQTQELGDRLER